MMNKKDFTTVRLARGEMHIYDCGDVKLPLLHRQRHCAE